VPITEFALTTDTFIQHFERHFMKTLVFAAMISMAATSAVAQVTVKEPWARATMPGQPVGAAYMKIESTTPATLVQVETDVAREVQVHQMQVQDGVMKMRDQGALELPPGKTIELAPGGLHLMLMGLKKPLNSGDTIALRMTFVDSKKAKSTSVVTVPVRPLGQ
jgi:copper(I)-binding protein